MTQNTAWTNAERSIGRLKELDLLDPARISDAPASEIARAISSSGYYNQKAGYLKAFCGFLMERFCGDVEAMRGEETSILRSELLSVKGIGEETADSILCYAVGAPVLVIDAYTRRLFRRLSPPEWSRQFREREPKYGEVQAFLMGRLKEENPFYNRFHALVVVHSKERCRKTPLCERCPMVGVCITGRERI